MTVSRVTDLATGLPAAEEPDRRGVLGMWVQYRIFVDAVPADFDYAWEYACAEARISRPERDMLAAVVTGLGTPLQLRSDGAFRAMVTEQDADAARTATVELGGEVTGAAARIADGKAIREVLARIVDGGAA